jgi:hypothetical protein
LFWGLFEAALGVYVSFDELRSNGVAGGQGCGSYGVGRRRRRAPTPQGVGYAQGMAHGGARGWVEGVAGAWRRGGDAPVTEMERGRRRWVEGVAGA